MATLAIHGGEPLRKQPFPKWPVHDEREAKAVAEVVASGKWGHVCCYRNLFDELSSKVEEFRNRFAEYHGVDYALPVPNGSVALEVALRNVGIGPGDEVITPPSTWVATNLAPIIVGAEPVFADVSPDNYCMDPDRVEEAVTPRTKAVIPVHIGGYTCDMDRLMAIAEEHDLVVIEDCAQSHGSRYKGALTGTIGHFGCFSFEISKLMTAGEGGVVITNDASLGDRVHGVCGEGGCQIEKMRANGKAGTGWNTRITEMQAAILICQLERLEDQRAKRVENAEYLKKRLSEIEGIAPLRQTREQNYFSYMFKYDCRHWKDVPKRVFKEALAAEGVPTFCSPGDQPPAYRSPYFHPRDKDYSHVHCPVAEKAFCEEGIGLQATWLLLGDVADMDDIIDAILKIREHMDELAG